LPISCVLRVLVSYFVLLFDDIIYIGDWPSHDCKVINTMSAFVVFCVAFLAALVNAVDEDVRPSAEPSECLCKFPKHQTPDKELLNDIRPLCGKR